MEPSPNFADGLTGADETTLNEIIREAESYLTAQLTAGIAADQRAISFSSVVSAGAVVVGGGGIALLQSANAEVSLTLGAFIVTVGLLIATFFANLSSMPAEFWYPGNDPKQWLDDVSTGKPLTRSLAEQAAHYSEMIGKNDRLMRRNSRQMRTAVWLCWGSLVAGSVWVPISLSGLAQLISCE